VLSPRRSAISVVDVPKSIPTVFVRRSPKVCALLCACSYLPDQTVPKGCHRVGKNVGGRDDLDGGSRLEVEWLMAFGIESDVLPGLALHVHGKGTNLADRRVQMLLEEFRPIDGRSDGANIFDVIGPRAERIDLSLTQLRIVGPIGCSERLSPSKISCRCAVFGLCGKLARVCFVGPSGGELFVENFPLSIRILAFFPNGVVDHGARDGAGQPRARLVAVESLGEVVD